MIRIILLSILLAAVGGCASVPSELKSSQAFADITPQQVQSGQYNGRHVRWGGVIIQVEPQNGKTCFETLGLPLDKSAEPKRDVHSIGRFIACVKGFEDPAAYPEGHSITFTGTVTGIQEKKVGDYTYGFPTIDASSFYLWPKEPAVVYVPYENPFWDPFWPYYYYPYPYPYYHRFR